MYRILLIPGICLLLVQLSLVVLLIVQHSRNRTSESQLRKLNRHLVQVQEEERNRIARELHDDFGQRLALVKIEFEMAMQENFSLSHEPSQAGLQKVLAGLDELAIDIQHLAHTLHSRKLEYLGLKAALKDLCGQVERQHRMSIDMETGNLAKSVSQEKELCVYRIAQEALHNIAKHSGADRASVKLTEADSVLQMQISDNGRGFNQAETPQGLGLASMRERLSIIGGNLQIQSTPGQGTVLSIQVPLNESATHESSTA